MKHSLLHSLTLFVFPTFPFKGNEEMFQWVRCVLFRVVSFFIFLFLFLTTQENRRQVANQFAFACQLAKGHCPCLDPSFEKDRESGGIMWVGWMLDASSSLYSLSLNPNLSSCLAYKAPWEGIMASYYGSRQKVEMKRSVLVLHSLLFFFFNFLSFFLFLFLFFLFVNGHAWLHNE